MFPGELSSPGSIGRKVRAPKGRVVPNGNRSCVPSRNRESATENIPPSRAVHRLGRVRVKRRPVAGRARRRCLTAAMAGVRAHRPGGDAGGTVNPTRCKAKQVRAPEGHERRPTSVGTCIPLTRNRCHHNRRPSRRLPRPYQDKDGPPESGRLERAPSRARVGCKIPAATPGPEVWSPASEAPKERSGRTKPGLRATGFLGATGPRRKVKNE